MSVFDATSTLDGYQRGKTESDDRLLESLIPDLESSIPRLVVAVHARPKTKKSKGLVVCVKTLTGKSVTIVCASNDTVDCVKSQIRVTAHVPVDDQRIMYGSKQLEDHRKLSYYKIKNNSSLYLIARLRGGFSKAPSASRSFVDVSNGSKVVKRELSHTAPDWRECTKGLNVEGFCENVGCRAYGERIVHRMGFDYFNLMKENDVECPECNTEVKPITCGFYSCAWKFEGIKTSDSFSISSRWQEAKEENIYHRFDERCNTVNWSSLVLMAKPLEEATAAKLTTTFFFCR
ncbi:unnamed protein product [Peronospora farinosa]|uniref:Ubiquitin-like domain-containing protein n=1 Tax=Peronospora farinosa TaxID=134698 RepID=A0ABN8CC24_9STRA|nr:unnamed protein product [Peronospora farinosa]